MPSLKPSNNFRPVVNHKTGNVLHPRKVLVNNSGIRWVQLNNSNYWYQVFRNEKIVKKAPFIIENFEIIGLAPNNASNRRNVYATLPENEWPIYGAKGISIMVERNGPGKPWRLVNKKLANKYNLKMHLGKGIGLWGGALYHKKK